MRTHSAPVPLKRPAVAVQPVAPRKTTRAAIVRRHSRSEKLTSVAGVALAVVLLLAGATYQMTSDDVPPPRGTAAAHPFVESRAARIVMPSDVAGQCREHSFDNDRGAFSEAKKVPCEAEKPRAMKGEGQGFSSFKEAFGGKK
jgi:hypothetical protein